MRIAVIAEGVLDQVMACGLADRIIAAYAPDWWDDKQIEHERQWCGLEPETEYTKWSMLNQLADRFKIRILGHQSDESGGFDYAAGRKAILLSRAWNLRVDVLLLVRDMDRQHAERRESLTEARRHADAATMTVLLAIPNPCREAWLLNGFYPANDTERERLREETQRLGVNPCESAQTLQAQRQSETRSAKRVLRFLTQGDRDREEECWKCADLDCLRQRGVQTNLAEYIQEIEQRLLPLLFGDTTYC